MDCVDYIEFRYISNNTFTQKRPIYQYINIEGRRRE